MSLVDLCSNGLAMVTMVLSGVGLFALGRYTREDDCRRREDMATEQVGAMAYQRDAAREERNAAAKVVAKRTFREVDARRARGN